MFARRAGLLRARREISEQSLRAIAFREARLIAGMAGVSRWRGLVGSESHRVISCDLEFDVTEDASMVFQVAAAASAGSVITEKLEIAGDSVAGASMREISGPHGGRLHLLQAAIGGLNLSYRAEIDVAEAPSDQPLTSDPELQSLVPSAEFSEVLYRRPSRYCPTDRLLGFALSEFGIAGEGFVDVQAIVDWIRRRIEYLP
jgi:hypothetical protein